MDEKCFMDLTATEQTDICTQMADVQKVTKDDMFKALASVNPTIETGNKLSWAGFCLVTGYVMATAKLPWEQLQQRQRSCKTDYLNYQRIN
jgi:hypothetical protein